MATFLDISIFQHFAGIFVFLIVFAIVYGFLLVTNMLKGKDGATGIYAIIALAFAFFALISRSTVLIITKMTPWFTVLIIFLFLVFFIIRMFVGDNDSFFEELIKSPSVYWILAVLFIIILIVSLSSTFGQQLLEKQPGITPTQNDTMMNNGQRIDNSANTTIILTQNNVATPQGATASNDFGDNVLQTLIHPKVLGMIMLLLIGMFTIILLAKTPSPD